MFSKETGVTIRKEHIPYSDDSCAGLYPDMYAKAARNPNSQEDVANFTRD